LGSFKRQAYKNEENTDYAYVAVFGYSGYQNEGTVLLQPRMNKKKGKRKQTQKGIQFRQTRLACMDCHESFSTASSFFPATGIKVARPSSTPALALGDVRRMQVGAVMPSVAITSNRWIRTMVVVVGNRMAVAEPHTPRTTGPFFQSTPQ